MQQGLLGCRLPPVWLTRLASCSFPLKGRCIFFSGLSSEQQQAFVLSLPVSRLPSLAPACVSHAASLSKADARAAHLFIHSLTHSLTNSISDYQQWNILLVLQDGDYVCVYTLLCAEDRLEEHIKKKKPWCWMKRTERTMRVGCFHVLAQLPHITAARVADQRFRFLGCFFFRYTLASVWFPFIP